MATGEASSPHLRGRLAENKSISAIRLGSAALLDFLLTNARDSPRFQDVIACPCRGSSVADA
jgi:hypothetical protein